MIHLAAASNSIPDLSQQQALFLDVISDHLDTWPSEDILAVVADERCQQQEAQFNAMKGCHKTGL